MDYKFVIAVATSINGQLEADTKFATTKENAISIMQSIGKDYKAELEDMFDDVELVQLPESVTIFTYNDFGDRVCSVLVEIGKIF